jgi:type I restriction enzyme, S subunit
MAIDWKTVSLESLIAPGRGISYGIVQPGPPVPDGVPIVRVGDVRNGRIATADPLRVSPTIESAYSRTRLSGGELILTLVGTVGEAAIVPEALAGWNTARAVAVIPIRKEIGSYWIQIVLRTPAVRSIISSRLNTTVQATLNLRDVAQLPILLPPQREREAITHILGTLDDKIELNRRMNETLEAMARTLFKSWFMDFDPVRAKAEGRDPCIPKSLDRLFPNRFKDSERGDIPEGWDVRSIYDIADVVYGAPFASSQFNAEGFGVPLLRIRDLVDESPGIWTPEIHQKGYRIQPGSIVVGMDGEFRAYLWGGSEAWLNQRLCVFVPRGNFSAVFVRNSIIEPLARVEATETATTVIHLGKNDIDQFSVLVPKDAVLTAFNQICQPWYDRIVVGKRESRTLSSIRDALLPKLLSGEIRVRDAEKIAGAAV